MTEMFGEAWPPMSVPDLAHDDDYDPRLTLNPEPQRFQFNTLQRLIIILLALSVDYRQCYSPNLSFRVGRLGSDSASSPNHQNLTKLQTLPGPDEDARIVKEKKWWSAGHQQFSWLMTKMSKNQ